MFCNHCGKEIPDGSKICSFCGQDIVETGSDFPPSKTNCEPTNRQNKFDLNNFDFKNIDKNKLKKYGIIAGAALIAIVLIIVICSSVSSKVSIKKYAADELVYTGINGYGSVDMSDIIDFDALNRDILKRAKEPSKISQLFGDSYSDYYYTSAADYITYECTSENNGKLSNGDKVIITITIDKDRMKLDPGFDKKISGGEKIDLKYEVSGLPEGTVIDVFDAVDNVCIDMTLGYPNLSINLKEDYKKDYGANGINVKTENNHIRIYGDEFQSFGVSLSAVTDNYDETSTSIKIGVNSETDAFIDKGIAIAPTEKIFKPVIINYVKNAGFSKEDLATLNKNMKSFAAQEFSGEAYKLEKVMLFCQENYSDCFLAYFYKVGDYYAVPYFDHLKQDQNGRIYEIDEVEPSIDGFFGYNTFDSIDNFKSYYSNYPNIVNIPIN